MTRTLLLALCLTLVRFSLASAAEAPAVDLVPGQLASYEGRTLFEQKTDGKFSTGMDVKTALAFISYAGGKDGERRILLARTVTPEGKGLALPASSDAAFYWVSRELEVTSTDSAEDVPPIVNLIESQLPAQFLPAFRIPEGAEAAAEDEVLVVSRSKAKLPLKVSVARDGSKVTVTRKLVDGKPVAFVLDGTPSVVQSWEEVMVLDTARKVLLESRRDVKAAGSRGDYRVDLSVQSELKLKDVRTLEGDERKQADLLDKELGGVFDDMRGKKHPRDVYGRIQALSKESASGLLPGLTDSLLARFAFYRQVRDAVAKASPSSGVGAVVGQEAPDFTLTGMDGKEVAFRAATKGKVVLLNFWGFGCPPCRMEAPYLSKLQEKYGDKGFTVIAVNGYDEGKGIVQGFIEQQGLKQPVLLMGKAVAREKYFVGGFPTNVWIDSNGKIVFRETGFAPSAFSSMEARVEKMLREAKLATGAPAGGGK